MKNSWKGIKSIHNFPPKIDESSKIISFVNQSVTDPRIIVNTFGNFFWSVAPKVQLEISLSYKTFFGYSAAPNQDSIFISP